jgi:hypothetical protein
MCAQSIKFFTPIIHLLNPFRGKLAFNRLQNPNSVYRSSSHQQIAVGSTRAAELFLRCDETDILLPNRSSNPSPQNPKPYRPKYSSSKLKGSVSTANNYIDRHREFTCDRITHKIINPREVSHHLSLSGLSNNAHAAVPQTTY